jgi:hypothetical protein
MRGYRDLELAVMRSSAETVNFTPHTAARCNAARPGTRDRRQPARWCHRPCRPNRVIQCAAVKETDS